MRRPKFICESCFVGTRQRSEVYCFSRKLTGPETSIKGKEVVLRLESLTPVFPGSF